MFFGALSEMPRRRETEPNHQPPGKHQAPISNLQRRTRLQHPVNQRTPGSKMLTCATVAWEFGDWSFCGAWNWELHCAHTQRKNCESLKHSLLAPAPQIHYQKHVINARLTHALFRRPAS